MTADVNSVDDDLPRIDNIGAKEFAKPMFSKKIFFRSSSNFRPFVYSTKEQTRPAVVSMFSTASKHVKVTTYRKE